MNKTLQTPEILKAQQIGQYTIELSKRESANGRTYYLVQVISARMKYPRMYCSYVEEKAAQDFAAIVKNYESSARFKEERKEQDKERKKTFKDSLTVGTILNTSWGYEQTNVEFFQVVSVRGSFVELREIGQNVTHEGFMCGQTVPIKDSFLSPRFEGDKQGVVLRRKIGAGHVTIDEVRTAWLWNGAAHYVSWYA